MSCRRRTKELPLPPDIAPFLILPLPDGAADAIDIAILLIGFAMPLVIS